MTSVDSRVGAFGELPHVFSEAFSVLTFERAAALAVQCLTRHLDSNDRRGVTLQEPADLIAQARALMSSDPHGDFDEQRFTHIIDLYLRTGIQVHTTGYMGRQFSSVAPAAGVFDMVSAMAPQPASFYEAGQLANVADSIMAQEFAALLGWAPNQFDMVATSGGALGNLTALLAARNRFVPQAWTEGLQSRSDGRRLGIAVGADSHYSVSRAAGVLGIGENCVVRLPLDDQRRIRVHDAVTVIDQAARDGIDIFCLVASAGTTATGSIDPLDELADLASERGLWLHVDGAHSASFLVSERLRPRLRGIERADSFILDAHKTLFVPAACTLLFYREALSSQLAFEQVASYVFDEPYSEASRMESGGKNLECTKRPSIVNLWLLWSMYGRQLLASKLETLVDLTDMAHGLISAQADFRVLHTPQSNILCFQYAPAGGTVWDRDSLQSALRDKVRSRGNFLISKADVGDERALRLVMMNHEITEPDVRALLDEIREAAREIGVE
ncbi:MAG: aminotransferase class V-fold PLP-dependent enzyme [Actinobacteria bacterium]|nr:aminotransferase class V-fold PLP-dependent enzyme [Actinomycetota bacterium]